MNHPFLDIAPAMSHDTHVLPVHGQCCDVRSIPVCSPQKRSERCYPKLTCYLKLTCHCRLAMSGRCNKVASFTSYSASFTSCSWAYSVAVLQVEQAQLVHLCTVMSTMHHRRAGYPFGTLVDFASDGAGYPIFCMSPLGIHTRCPHSLCPHNVLPTFIAVHSIVSAQSFGKHITASSGFDKHVRQGLSANRHLTVHCFELMKCSHPLPLFVSSAS